MYAGCRSATSLRSMVTNPNTALVGRPPGPVSPRIAWYARYIWELPSIRYRTGGFWGTAASPIKRGSQYIIQPDGTRADRTAAPGARAARLRAARGLVGRVRGPRQAV